MTANASEVDAAYQGPGYFAKGWRKRLYSATRTNNNSVPPITKRSVVDKETDSPADVSKDLDDSILLNTI